MFEAARWAPSAFNYQPWQFRYAETETDEFERFCDLLLPFNALWARKASIVAFVLSDILMDLNPDADPQPSRSHSFDTGAAWALLALQATRMGYGAHAMTGVDFEKARRVLRVPERFRIEAAIAIGPIGDPETLPQKLRDREGPSSRKPREEIAFKGPFPLP